MGGYVDNEKRTLIELITKNFTEIKRKKRPNKRKSKSRLSIPSLLINLKINGTIIDAKEESNEDNSEETIEEESSDENKITMNGGYGTINKHYGTSPTVKYVSYDRIWDHLGGFKSQSMYQNLSEERGPIAHNASESTGVLVSNEVITKAEKHFKYFVSGELLGDVGYVPPTGLGISSVEWEKYRLMTQISFYSPLLKLMNSVA